MIKIKIEEFNTLYVTEAKKILLKAIIEMQDEIEKLQRNIIDLEDSIEKIRDNCGC